MKQIKADLAKAKAMFDDLCNNGMGSWPIANEVNARILKLQGDLESNTRKELETQARQMLLEARARDMLAEDKAEPIKTKLAITLNAAPTPIQLERTTNGMRCADALIDLETILCQPRPRREDPAGCISRIIAARQYCRLGAGLEQASSNVTTQWKNELRRIGLDALSETMSQAYDATGLNAGKLVAPAAPAPAMTNAEWTAEAIGSKKILKRTLLELFAQRPGFETYIRGCIYDKQWGLSVERFHSLIKTLTGQNATDALTDRLVNDYDTMMQLMAKCDGIDGQVFSSLSYRAREVLGLDAGHERLDIQRIYNELNQLRVANKRTPLVLRSNDAVRA